MRVVCHSHVGKILVGEHLENTSRWHGCPCLSIIAVPKLPHLPTVFLQIGGEVGEEHADEVSRHKSVHSCSCLSLIEIRHIDTQRTHESIIRFHACICVESHRDVEWHIQSILPFRIIDRTSRKVVDSC